MDGGYTQSVTKRFISISKCLFLQYKTFSLFHNTVNNNGLKYWIMIWSSIIFWKALKQASKSRPSCPNGSQAPLPHKKSSHDITPCECLLYQATFVKGLHGIYFIFFLWCLIPQFLDSTLKLWLLCCLFQYYWSLQSVLAMFSYLLCPIMGWSWECIACHMLSFDSGRVYRLFDWQQCEGPLWTCGLLRFPSIRHNTALVKGPGCWWWIGWPLLPGLAVSWVSVPQASLPSCNIKRETDTSLWLLSGGAQ